MQLRFLKFSLPFVIFIGSYRSFHAHGWVIWAPVIFAFFLIPLLEAELDKIKMALDERERADHFRLKLVKRSLERKRGTDQPYSGGAP